MKNKFIIVSEKEYELMKDDLIFLFASYNIPLSTVDVKPIFNEHELFLLQNAAAMRSLYYWDTAINDKSEKSEDLDVALALDYGRLSEKVEKLMKGTYKGE